jgi:hypothetical protein
MVKRKSEKRIGKEIAENKITLTDFLGHLFYNWMFPLLINIIINV